MKRDMDLIREILLWMEQQEDRFIIFNQIEIFRGNRDLTIGHVGMLLSGGLIEETQKGVLRISWEGHEFLDKVRDLEIWRKTKDGAAAIGSWSVRLLGDMATGYIRAKAAELGLPLT